MADQGDLAEVLRRFAESARHSETRAPLNAALASVVASDHTLAALLLHAQPTQRLPVLLLAALHDLVLQGDAPDLAPWYRSVSDDPRSPDERVALRRAVAQTVDAHRDRLVETIATRRTQTNEVGRCALLLPALALVAAEANRALTHLDVGASAGLNLALARFRYRYDDRETIEPAEQPPVAEPVHEPLLLECATRGSGPIPRSIPAIAASCGIDERPVDITDPDEARWLRACCWPDQVDRFHRLDTAVRIASARPPELLAGDAVDAVAPAIERLTSRGHPVVTTTWVMNYLPAERRQAFVERLDDVATTTDLAWVFAEAPALTPELPHADDQVDEHITALTVVTWTDGNRSVRQLGRCHPHGYWIHWRSS